MCRKNADEMISKEREAHHASPLMSLEEEKRDISQLKIHCEFKDWHKNLNHIPKNFVSGKRLNVQKQF